ncbi:MAG: hypothetical protein ACJ70M_08075 [Nitrososphaera sp.]
MFEGTDHVKIKAEQANPASLAGRAISMEADNITALICKSIDNKISVCNSETIRTLPDKT